MAYPPRADLLVLNADGRDIPQTFGPGQFDIFVDGLRGKSREDPSKFSVLDPAELEAGVRRQIAAELQERFGTPNSPLVKVTEDPAGVAKDLVLDPDTLAYGSLLYRRHCLHCHGVSGDGRGPTALWVNPPPRDYRRGLFKFTSVLGSKKSKPMRADLLKTLRDGIEGTSMPTFKAQPPRDLEALVSYVIHLSIRGSVEFDALKEAMALKEAKATPMDSKAVAQLVLEKTNEFAGDWRNESTPIGPEATDPAKKLHPYPYNPDDAAETKASAGRGYELFVGKGICISCHTDFGRQSGFMYDDWGTLVRPRNLTVGVYRGGQRPIDLYYRIHSGIGPSKMPTQPAEIAGDPKAMWDLVNFVRALPYPAMLPNEVRQKVYGERK
jgi:mono/diheme cytochrome c family protein